jgi:hypothetical protein
MSTPANTPADSPDIDPRELADLSHLADGTLDPARRAEVQARIAASPELTALYERELSVVEVLHEARASDRAPAALRARIEAARPSKTVRARRRISYGGALAGALAAVALALALILPAGSPGAPSVSQAAGLAVLGPAMGAPATDPNSPDNLEARVGDLSFPNWSQQYKSPATGQRSDRINGRTAVTVYYSWRGQEIAYTIVGAPALATPAARVTNVSGTQVQTLSQHGRTVVTWRRNNHTCVLSATGVPAIVLQRLAASEGTGDTTNVSVYRAR